MAVFAFVDAALLKPLALHDALTAGGVFERVPMFPQSNLSYRGLSRLEKAQQRLQLSRRYKRARFTLAPDGAQRAPGARVSDDFLRTLGVAPILGRDFRPGEDLPAAQRAVLLSYAAWHNRYGGQPDVLGRTVTLNGAPHDIVGVLPREFHFAPPEAAEFWTTLHDQSSATCDEAATTFTAWRDSRTACRSRPPKPG